MQIAAHRHAASYRNDSVSYREAAKLRPMTVTGWKGEHLLCPPRPDLVELAGFVDRSIAQSARISH